MSETPTATATNPTHAIDGGVQFHIKQVFCTPIPLLPSLRLPPLPFPLLRVLLLIHILHLSVATPVRNLTCFLFTSSATCATLHTGLHQLTRNSAATCVPLLTLSYLA